MTATSSRSQLDVRRLSDSLGAEVGGVVLNDFHGTRVIQRVTVMGDEPAPAPPPRWAPYGSKTATFWRDTAMHQQLKRQRT